MPVARDINAEQRALKTYQNIYKKNPTSSTDWDALHNLAYPAASGGLPDEFKKASDSSLGSAGLNSPAAAPLAQNVADSNLGNLQTDVATAKTNLGNLSNPNEALTVLQNAIRTKSGVMEQPLGQSDVFKAAGLTGIGSLNASLAETNNKFTSDYSQFQNTIKTMSGTYKDMADKALQDYNNSYTAFKDESDRLQKIQDDINSHKDAIETMNLQYQNQLKLEAYKNAHPDITDITKGNESGYTNVNGTWKKNIDTTFKSPSGDTYDVAKYAQLDDGTPNPEHISAMNDAVQKMKTLFPATQGKLTSAEDIDKFIQQYYPGSPITSKEVVNAAGKYGIDWETILATMAAETQMGTDGSKGSQQNNFGNVGNTNTAMKNGQPVGLANAQAGVDAVAKTMSLPYYKRNQVSSTIQDNGITIDPNSASILAVTGLSQPAFAYATQGTPALTRMTADQRQQYMKEWQDYQIKHGVDSSTFKSQYDALGKTVEANSLRNNQAGVAENELTATISNLKSAADEAGLKTLKGLNIAKIWAGSQLNKPEALTYKTHLEQLRNEFAMYNAAVSGQIDSNGNIRQISEADNKKADEILQNGLSSGSLDGFEKALKASMSKLGVVLANSVDAQNKQVWKLFGVSDKYKGNTSSSSNKSTEANNDPLGIR